MPCDVRSGSECSGEDERVEFGIPSLGRLRRVMFFGDRRVLGEEIENVEFGFDVRTWHGGDAKD